MTKIKAIGRTRLSWMIRRDLPSVLIIENESSEFPWTEGEFLRCLRKRNCMGMVVTEGRDEQVIGFMVYELRRHHIQVLSMAVAFNRRRQGVGAEMIHKLIDKLSYQRRNRIVMDVRESNLPAQLSLRKNGFKATRILKDFYLTHSREDGYRFVYLADEPVEA